MISLTFYDKETHNTAIIDAVQVRPYYGAKMKESYRLTLKNNDFFVYHVSMYETLTEAMKEMRDIGNFEIVSPSI